jgi:hypothetical protein
MNVIPDAWLPAVPMKRVHGHWTAGGHEANATDRKAYHVLVEGDGKLVRGVPSIAANSASIKDGYAAHTLNANTDAIGISMCGMAGAVESPFVPGRTPLTLPQWTAFIAAVAQLCRVYDIPVTPKTVLFHAEVQANLGIKQRNKWDVTRLVFDPATVGAKVIGDKMRREVSALLAGKAPAEPVEPVPEGARARVTAASLNFRRAPDGEITGSLPEGLIVEVIAIDGDWLNIETPAGYRGWVSRAHVVMVDGPPAAEPTKPDPRRKMIDDIRAMLDDLEAVL